MGVFLASNICQGKIHLHILSVNVQYCYYCCSVWMRLIEIYLGFFLSPQAV
jgi:hypothetical protein